MKIRSLSLTWLHTVFSRSLPSRQQLGTSNLSIICSFPLPKNRPNCSHTVQKLLLLLLLLLLGHTTFAPLFFLAAKLFFFFIQLIFI